MNEPLPSASGPDLDALFALARGERPDTSRAEYGFETRLLARLHERTLSCPVALWAGLTWRMAPFFAACVVALAIWNSELAAQTSDAAYLSLLQNPESADMVEGLN